MHKPDTFIPFDPSVTVDELLELNQRFTDWLANTNNKGSRKNVGNQEHRLWIKLHNGDIEIFDIPVEYLGCLYEIWDEVVWAQRWFQKRDEWKFITNTCTSGEIIYGLEGNERLLLYRIAIETGFRASELKSLKICNFDYNSEITPPISCPAEHTKNGRFAKQLITSDLAKQLHEITYGVVATQSLLKMPHASNLARMLRNDLKLADVHGLPEPKLMLQGF